MPRMRRTGQRPCADVSALHAPVTTMKIPPKLLNEREQLVVRLRDEEKLTWREIGARFGVSREWPRQIHVKASAKLKEFAVNGEGALSLLPMRARRVVEELKIGSTALARDAIVIRANS